MDRLLTHSSFSDRFCSTCLNRRHIYYRVTASPCCKNLNSRKPNIEAGEMAQQPRVFFLFCSGLSSSSRHPHRNSQPSATPVPRIWCPPLASMGTRMHVVHRYACKQNNHTHKNRYAHLVYFGGARLDRNSLYSPGWT